MTGGTVQGGLAVVLVSGGLDSCVTAAVAAREHRLALLHATYGQKTATRERRAFEALADHFGVSADRRRVLDLGFLGALGGSALTDEAMAVPRGAPGEGIPVTYVPFRNAHLLAAAVSWAEVLGAGSVWIGAVEEDSSGYPDTRRAFLDAFEKAVQLGTACGQGLVIRSPLVELSKAQIVRRGLELGAPLELTWSCYVSEDLACGECESCWLRLKGFAEAGVSDPLAYRHGPGGAGK
ncbi:MAG: 7-cyano-7-deazaguanine synthase QueC [Acidobacteriota bacterium]|nr:7-cyano-7-deazaguanine synthase QueC [Acidobacteriota bacterium]MDQ7088777.1 7-cyano-7-deazaguanine synthase QueC [Acidobacteriota bacterium]